MTPEGLLRILEGEGVRLWIEDGRLRYRAPHGVLTDERLEMLRADREELMVAVRRRGTAGSLRVAPDQAYDAFPLTDVQAAYLLGRRAAFEYGGVGCHGYAEYRNGVLDPSRLERAWRALIERHPMLRATFAMDGTQRILASAPPFTVTVGDGTMDFEAEVQLRRAELSHRVYDTAVWPLFDIALTRGATQCVLHVSFDLLIADFLSVRRLLTELAQLYEDEHARLPPIDVTFRDYVMTVQQLDDRSTDKTWWRDRLAELPPRPELPLGKPAVVACARPRFERHRVAVSRETWECLARNAATHATTASAAVLAAFCEVVARWSSSPRFTLALTLLDRLDLHPAISRVVGDFTSISLLTINHDKGDSFAARASACQSRLWEALDHRRYSGVEVMRDIAWRRSQEDALFPIVFTSALDGGDHAAPARWDLGNADYAITQTPQVWLDCQVMPHHAGIMINWDVRAGVFRPDVIEAMAESFERLVRDLASPDAWRSGDPMTLPEAQMRRRREANQTDAQTSGRLLHEAALAQAGIRPEAPAVIAGGRMLTFGELHARAQGVASHLADLGVEAGEVVAIVLPKGIDQVVAVFGVLCAGAGYLPVDVHQPPVRRATILQATAVRFVLTDDMGQSWPPGVHSIDVMAVPPCDQPPTARPNVTALAYVISTTGSTGHPKGVAINHGAAENTVDDMGARLAIGPGDAMLGVAHLGFDLSVFDLFGVLGRGATLVLPDPDRVASPAHWVELCVRHHVTLWNSVPAQAQMLADYLADMGDTRPANVALRWMMLSGDWIPVDLPDRIRALLPEARLLALGGATEAAIWSVAHPIDAVDRAAPSIPYGRPLRNQTLHVLDEGMRPRPDWVAGELYIGGAGLADEYYRDQARTAASFICHPSTGERLYRTGDLARYRDDGAIELLGRRDGQVKLRGYRVELPEVETAANALPDVSAAAAVVVGDGDARQLALAVESAVDIDIPRLRTELGRVLPHYMVPARIAVVPRLPLTRNGKVDRAAVAGLLLPHCDTQPPAEFESPEGETEALIAEIFGRVLGLLRVGRRDDFLALGGNSLLAARAVSETLRAVGPATKKGFDELLVALLNHRTAAGFSAALAVGDAPAPAAAVPLVECATGGIEGGSAIIITLGIGAASVPMLASLAEQVRGQALTLSLSTTDAVMALDSRSLIDQLVHACFDRISERVTDRRVVIAALDPDAIAALELARRLRESGCQVSSLLVLAAADHHPAPAARFAEAASSFVAFPYTGDVVIVGDARASGIDWSDVVLGELRRIDAATLPRIIGELVSTTGGTR